MLIMLGLWGCAVLSRNYQLGTEAAVNKDWDQAVIFYQKAVLEDPNNSAYRLALIRASIAASLHHLQQARNLASQGKKEEALAEYEKAIGYDPSNIMIVEEARRFAGKPEEKKPEIKELELPFRLKVDDKKIELKFINASVRSIFEALGKYAQINVIFDEQFRDTSLSIDLVDMSFEQALNSICLASKNFYRVIDEKTVVIAPDLPAKRLQYELNAIKTFYLSNVNAEDMRAALQLMLRTQFRMPSIHVDKGLNSITIKDTPESIALAEKMISLWDKPKGEVVIDLEIMEVSRSKLRQLGLDFEQHLIGLRYNQESSDKGWFKLSEMDLSKRENYQITLPSALIQLLEQDADTKVISQPRLRGLHGEKIEYLVGDKIPIPRTTFTPIAAGGVSQQPVTSFAYEDVGIDVKITPRIHFEKEITLELEIKIKSLGGSGFADIPIIATREVKNMVRLKDGETNLLAGLLKDEERKTLRGIAGLKSIPIIGSLFSNTDQRIQQTDVILTITPYIIRTIPLGKEDSKPVWVNPQEVSPPAVATLREPEEEALEMGLEEERELRRQPREEAGKNLIYLEPFDFEVPREREFRIMVSLRSEAEIGSLSVNISFNPQVLNLKEIERGSFIRQLGKDLPFLKNIDNSSGSCTIGFSGTDVAQGVRGSGDVALLVFQSKGKGESSIAVSNVAANSPDGQTISFETREARVRVR